MPALPGALRSAESDFRFTFVACVLLIPLALSACTKMEVIVSTPETLKYTSVAIFHWISWTAQSEFNVNNFYCEILFRASGKRDIIRLEVISSFMKPRMLNSNLCLDKVTAYDGLSARDEKLGVFCGSEVPVFESSGSSLLLVIETYKSLADKEYIGFLLNYSSIDRDHRGLVASFHQSQSTLGANTIVLVTLSAVIVYCVLFVIVYRQCKYAHTVRRTLTVSRNVPADLRVPLTTVQDQASLALPVHRQNQLFHNNTLPDILTNVNTISRPGSAQGPQRSGRVRHPAGDVCNTQVQPHLPPLCPSQNGISNDGCSGYHSAKKAVTPETIEYTHHTLPADSSGVFYAGNVDELGILHPPAGQNHLAVSAAHPTGCTYVCHVDTDGDHRSREGNQVFLSLYPSGRTSPRDSTLVGSWRADSLRRDNRSHAMVVMISGSPQLVKNVDTEGQTLTFYGMIDAAAVGGAAVGGAAVAAGDGVVVDAAADVAAVGDDAAGDGGVGDVCSDAEPPPSYEDAILGNMQYTS